MLSNQHTTIVIVGISFLDVSGTPQQEALSNGGHKRGFGRPQTAISAELAWWSGFYRQLHGDPESINGVMTIRLSIGWTFTYLYVRTCCFHYSCWLHRYRNLIVMRERLRGRKPSTVLHSVAECGTRMGREP